MLLGSFKLLIMNIVVKLGIDLPWSLEDYTSLRSDSLCHDLKAEDWSNSSNSVSHDYIDLYGSLVT